MPKKKSSQPNQSLIDGISALQALATSPEPIGSRELSRRLGFEPTRANRLLKTLAYLGIARQTANRKYTAGPGMHVLAAQSLFASGLVHNALPTLEELRRFNHVVALGVLWRDNVSYLYHAPPGVHSLEAIGRIGLYPATNGGIGLVLLADHSNDYIRELYADRDIPHFPSGIESLIEELEIIRNNGYARIEVKPDQHTIAICADEQAHTALGLSGWIPEESTKTIVTTLREAAGKIAASTESASDVESQVMTELTKLRQSV